MKLWIDDVRTAPDGYVWCKSVYDAFDLITEYENRVDPFELIDLDHDAGIYSSFGGDYINVLYWLEETGRNYPIRIHSMNPVGVMNMRRIIQHNGWKEIV